MNGNFNIWNDKSIILDISYLKLEVQPFRLVKKLIHQRSQETLDQMIGVEYKKIISDVSDFLKNNEIDDENDEIIPEILKLSTFIRDILPLHSDDESIELTVKEEKVLIECRYIWKYSANYGFKTTTTEIKW